VPSQECFESAEVELHGRSVKLTLLDQRAKPYAQRAGLAVGLADALVVQSSDDRRTRRRRIKEPFLRKREQCLAIVVPRERRSTARPKFEFEREREDVSASTGAAKSSTASAATMRVVIAPNSVLTTEANVFILRVGPPMKLGSHFTGVEKRIQGITVLRVAKRGQASPHTQACLSGVTHL
jgi:hypothetical protein